MMLSQEIQNAIDDKLLLKHPFYIKWIEGKLKKETLQEYARQYGCHVRAFPRYISATHSQCEDIESRRVLLENLLEEEGFEEGYKDHPTLWKNFALGLGLSEKEYSDVEACVSIENVIHSFLKYAYSSYEEGLASFYVYESQVPEVAETKISGLRKHYKIEEKDTLEFFSVHQKADILHREECEKLINQFSEDKKEKAIAAARKAAEALWDFLSEMNEVDRLAA